MITLLSPIWEQAKHHGHMLLDITITRIDLLKEIVIKLFVVQSLRPYRVSSISSQGHIRIGIKSLRFFAFLWGTGCRS